MLARGRSIALLVCVAVLLCCTLGFKALYRVGVSLPAFLGTGEEKSYLEGRTYTELPAFSLASFADGSFQTSLESYIADALPMREAALNANRGLQRVAIAQGAALLGYEVWPTYFGSGYLYCPADDRIFEMPAKTTDQYASNVAKTAQAISAFALAHPELNVYFAMPYRSSILDMGPVSGLVSDQVGASFFEEQLYGELDASVGVVDLAPTSYEDFDATYFRTDHHWSMRAAYRAYVAINAAMGNADSTVAAGYLLQFDGAGVYGGMARLGLDLDVQRESVVDYEFDLPALTVTKAGEELGYDLLASTELYKAGYDPIYPCRPLYENYFHYNFGEFTITNHDLSQGKTLLLVADSFSNCIERLFACSYQTVYVLDPRYADESVEEFVAAHPETDDVLVMESYNTLLRGKL